ncbi:MAG: TlpA disulfide reductase family protein [Solirubrobacteraceae bacterium]
MKLSLTTTIVSMLGAALIGLLIYGVSTQAANRSLDEEIAHGAHPQAPLAQTSLPALSGQGRMTLASFRGKVVLLNFWASWCTACQEEARLLERAQRELAPHGATVLGVTWQDPTTDSLRFVKKYGLTFPNYHDANGELVSAFGTRQLPESFLINRRGEIVKISRGQIAAEFVKQALSVAEAGGGSATARAASAGHSRTVGEGGATAAHRAAVRNAAGTDAGGASG